MEQHETDNFGHFAELPQPQDLGSGAQEKGGAAHPETPANKPPAAAPQTQSSQPSPIQAGLPVDPTADQPAAQPMGQSAMIADDADLIEKEWVVKAKAIVAQTRDDPHAQNKEMNKVKADYLKKRYNKDLKVSEG